MNISPIRCCNTKYYVKNINKNSNNSNLNNSNLCNKNHKANNNVSFGFLIGITTGLFSYFFMKSMMAREHRKTMKKNGFKSTAEYFHDMSDESIDYICEKLDLDKQDKKELLEEISKVRKGKEKTLNEITRLSSKEALGESNIATQKVNLQTDFINYLEQDENEFSDMNEYPIPNGILLYGSSREKEEFVQWISDSVPTDSTVVKSFSFDINNPEKSFTDLVDTVEENNNLYYNANKKRIILIIDSLTPLLQRVDNNLFKTQAKFKTFMENCAKKYHTTIITTVDSENLHEFEKSAIGKQRFSTYKLKDGITSEEKTTLKNLKEEILRLESKASDVHTQYIGALGPFEEGNLTLLRVCDVLTHMEKI